VLRCASRRVLVQAPQRAVRLVLYAYGVCAWCAVCLLFAVGFRLSYVPALRCVSCRASYEPTLTLLAALRCATPTFAPLLGRLAVVLPPVVLYAHGGQYVTRRRLLAVRLCPSMTLPVDGESCSLLHLVAKPRANP
jgi:hypothetical protein